MTRQLYKDQGHSLGRYRCVTLGKNDKCLSGKRGEVWEYSPGLYSAFIALKSGDEKIISFKSKDLGKWILKLEVPPSPSEQVFWVNNPNARFDA